MNTTHKKQEEKKEAQKETKKDEGLQSFFFPDVRINGRDGISIKAKNQDEANKELEKLLSNQK